ncbi:hypothetical protein NM208_g537 [Fusarium decemcellulare]|uniref:Uncharacterized protein n=2 Tax=Fusarium decemcellulare TaxID=57161 RepID=A0ACC1SAN9_9HYPO|nr:hypothetical protein NM208_g7095 [Fusarium decemcellulare]KAJ3549379.1 hypothetical protein NM208_g537 [Fusarium decemcellulare]
MAQPNIHSFYRVWFTCVDPLTLVPTVYALIFTPEFMLEGLIPLTMSAYNPDQSFLFHQLAALYAFVAIMFAGVLRVSPDVKVWRIIIGAVLLIDIAILASMCVSLEHQGRLKLSAWRWQDWGNLVFTGGVAIIRTIIQHLAEALLEISIQAPFITTQSLSVDFLPPMNFLTAAEPLCPLDDIRTSRELITKFVIAHFTAGAAFCHYLSLRNYDLATVEPILFLLCPLIVMVQTSIGLLLVNGALLGNLLINRTPLREALNKYLHHLKMLFGKKPVAQPSPRIARSSTGSLEAGGPTEANRSTFAKMYLIIGRLLVVFGVLFQCVASIFLYARRIDKKGWKSLTIVDFRSFELAIGGATVSVLSIALLLNIPGFARPAPDPPYESCDHIELLLPMLRGDTRRSRRWWCLPHTPDHNIGEWPMMLYGLCHIACMSNGSLVVIHRSHWLLGELVMRESLYLACYVFVPAILGVLLVVVELTKRLTRKGKIAGISVLLQMLSYPPLVYLGFTIVPPLAMLLSLGMVEGIFVVLWAKGNELYSFSSEMAFAAAPDKSQACPTLWKDPVSDYLWSLI